MSTLAFLLAATLAVTNAAPDAAVKAARTKAEMSRLATQGRNVFVAIAVVNAGREASGRDGVWPKSERNATEYFRALYDMDNFNQKDWNPLLRRVDTAMVFDASLSKSKWIVAKGLDDTVSDLVPVLVSANVDPASLITAEGEHDAAGFQGRLRFTGDFAVVIHKVGVAQVVTQGAADLSLLYGRRKFTLPGGFGYLVP